MKGIRFFLTIGILAIVLIGFIAYKVYNKPHRNIAVEKAAFVKSADELFDDYEADEEKANTLYLDKVIEVTGPIETITLNNEEAIVYTLRATNAMLGGISATLSGDSNATEDYKSGDAIRLKCRCTGKLMDVVLIDCSIISNEG